MNIAIVGATGLVGSQLVSLAKSRGHEVIALSKEPGTGFDGYYRAKFAHEQATLAFAPGPHVVHSSQFHDIARQAIGWGRDGDQSTIRDLTIQPVAVSAMVEVLLAAATGAVDTEVTEVAGPQREQLANLSTRYAAHVGDPVSIVAAQVGDAVRHGILLPGSQAHLVGPSFAEWLASVPVPRAQV